MNPPPEIASRHLPRLVVISDVNVERTGGGALVLYRLLRDYPPDRLTVFSYPTQNWPNSIERLPGVRYIEIPYRIPRWIWNRFNPFWPVAMSHYIRHRAGEIVRGLGAFRPEAVLSVAHDYLWFLADAVASRLSIPLHLILHDDWPTLQTLSQPGWIRREVRDVCSSRMGRVLKRASTLFSVSPGMGEHYRKAYGVETGILYPSRGEDSPTPFPVPRTEAAQPLVVSYAGMIHQEWAARSLRCLADVLLSLGGFLDLYVPYPETRLTEMKLSGPNIRSRGFFPASVMAEQVRTSSHILFLPASFNEAERTDVSTLFPSKLADYTAIGLPILIWGPPYSSAARWGMNNPGSVELVAADDPSMLRVSLEKLAADPAYANRIAKEGVANGIRDFDPASVRSRFVVGITRK